MIRRGRDKLAQTGASYLLGMGWNQETLAEERMPTRADLDQISREVPVCLLRCCAHVAACNTPMLERLKTLTGVGGVCSGKRWTLSRACCGRRHAPLHVGGTASLR